MSTFDGKQLVLEWVADDVSIYFYGVYTCPHDGVDIPLGIEVESLASTERDRLRYILTYEEARELILNVKVSSLWHPNDTSKRLSRTVDDYDEYVQMAMSSECGLTYRRDIHTHKHVDSNYIMSSAYKDIYDTHINSCDPSKSSSTEPIESSSTIFESKESCVTSLQRYRLDHGLPAVPEVVDENVYQLTTIVKKTTPEIINASLKPDISTLTTLRTRLDSWKRTVDGGVVDILIDNNANSSVERLEEAYRQALASIDSLEESTALEEYGAFDREKPTASTNVNAFVSAISNCLQSIDRMIISVEEQFEEEEPSHGKRSLLERYLPEASVKAFFLTSTAITTLLSIFIYYLLPIPESYQPSVFKVYLWVAVVVGVLFLRVRFLRGPKSKFYHENGSLNTPKEKRSARAKVVSKVQSAFSSMRTPKKKRE